MSVLITGGAGYLGSHACVEFQQAGFDCVAFDNLHNGHEFAVQRAGQISGKPIPLVVGDIRDEDRLVATIETYQCSAVVHFAGLKAVGDSSQNPVEYYDVNVGGSLSLLKAMDKCNVRRMIYSSSATVYGEPEQLPYREDHPLRPANVYGRCKLMVEQILQDTVAGNSDWAIGILRYFNPIGAHESGMIGEDSKGPPNNLMPVMNQVATGNRARLQIFGEDYPTRDGTGVRDYIHVTDLIQGHVKALHALDKPSATGVLICNLGTGTGYSVREMVKAFEHASNVEIPCEIVGRRSGDIAEFYADPSYAKQTLNWVAKRSLAEMCRDNWNWVSKNPSGFSAE